MTCTITAAIGAGVIIGVCALVGFLFIPDPKEAENGN
jgi:hypothetical protein